jgi:MoaA/NifB/PqqE/SkfB family radical SAM enzyme
MNMTSSKVRFSWDLHWSCNYRCPYCWWHGRWDELKKRNVYPGREKLLDVWKRIHRKYGEAHIEIAGGEPSAYPEFNRFLVELLQFHTVGIMTNLSGDVGELLALLPRESYSRLKIGATFHPLFANIDEFLPKAIALRRAGLSLGILYLAYPPQVKDIPRLKELFARNDIFFSVSTFWGTYNGREYPSSYTDEERGIIEARLGERAGEKFQLEPVTTRGKLCNAGYTYGIIHPEGEVIRCGGGSWKGENIIIGNIFDEAFTLWDSPRPCHSDVCPCNEWAFLLEKEDGR